MASIRHAASQVWLFNLLVLIYGDHFKIVGVSCLSLVFPLFAAPVGTPHDLLICRSNLRLEFFFKNTYYSQLWFGLVLSQLHLALVFLSCGLALVWSQLQFGIDFNCKYDDLDLLIFNNKFYILFIFLFQRLRL